MITCLLFWYADSLRWRCTCTRWWRLWRSSSRPPPPACCSSCSKSNMVIKHFHPGSIESPLLCTWSSPSQCIWSLPYCVPGVPLTVYLESPSRFTCCPPHCVQYLESPSLRTWSSPQYVPGIPLTVYLESPLLCTRISPHCVPGVPLNMYLEYPSLCAWSLPLLCTWSLPHCVPVEYPSLCTWSPPHCVPGVSLTVYLESPSLCTWSPPHCCGWRVRPPLPPPSPGSGSSCNRVSTILLLYIVGRVKVKTVMVIRVYLSLESWSIFSTWLYLQWAAWPAGCCPGRVLRRARLNVNNYKTSLEKIAKYCIGLKPRILLTNFQRTLRVQNVRTLTVPMCRMYTVDITFIPYKLRLCSIVSLSVLRHTDIVHNVCNTCICMIS